MSSEMKNDGGPAFPQKERVYRMGYATEDFRPVGGMTLRDYFAAKALQGMLSDIPKSCYGLDWQQRVTTTAYELADAMLAARSR